MQIYGDHDVCTFVICDNCGHVLGRYRGALTLGEMTVDKWMGMSNEGLWSVCVSMCVCVYVCMYVCMYVCVYVCVCMYVCIYVCVITVGTAG